MNLFDSFDILFECSFKRQKNWKQEANSDISLTRKVQLLASLSRVGQIDEMPSNTDPEFYGIVERNFELTKCQNKNPFLISYLPNYQYQSNIASKPIFPRTSRHCKYSNRKLYYFHIKALLSYIGKQYK